MQDDPSALYLITKGGAYYRPNAQGYTRDKSEAGRFSLAEAVSHSHPNGPDGPRDGISYEVAPTPMQDNLTPEYIAMMQARVDATKPEGFKLTEIASWQDNYEGLWRKVNRYATEHEDVALNEALGELQRQTETLTRENAELKDMRVLLPPASIDNQTYLDGWCEGQSYLILNYREYGQFERAISDTDAITTLTAERDAALAEVAALDGKLEGLQAVVSLERTRNINITAKITATQARLDEAVGYITTLADDLEAEVNDRWGYDERLKSKLDRDMAPVVEARAFLAKETGNG